MRSSFVCVWLRLTLTWIGPLQQKCAAGAAEVASGRRVSLGEFLTGTVDSYHGMHTMHTLFSVPEESSSPSGSSTSGEQLVAPPRSTNDSTYKPHHLTLSTFCDPVYFSCNYRVCAIFPSNLGCACLIIFPWIGLFPKDMRESRFMLYTHSAGFRNRWLTSGFNMDSAGSVRARVAAAEEQTGHRTPAAPVGRAGALDTAGSARQGQLRRSAAAATASSPVEVRNRPILAADRSESSGSESAPSPQDAKKLPPQVPHVSVPAVGSGNGSSGGGQVSNSGSGHGPERESMRSTKSTSSAGSHLAGIAFVPSVASTDSFALSPESSPRRPKPSPLMPPLKETSSVKDEERTPESSKESSKDEPPAPETNVAVAPAKETIAPTATSVATVDVPPPVEISDTQSIAAPLTYSPVHGPSDSPLKVFSPFTRVAPGTPGDFTSEKLSEAVVMVKQLRETAPTPRGGRGGDGGGSGSGRHRTIESSSEAGSVPLSSSSPPPAGLRPSRHLDGGVSGRGGSDDGSDSSPDRRLSSFEVHGPAAREEDESSSSPVSSRVSRPTFLPPYRSESAEGSISSLTRQDPPVWEAEALISPTALSAHTESTLGGYSSSSSASVSAESAAASASMAAASASLAATAARTAADQVRGGIWNQSQEQLQQERQQRQWQLRRQPRSAMARSAAAAGAKAAAAKAAAVERHHAQQPQTPSRAESKGALRVRDPGIFRIPSSQSTEAPTSKSISYVAPSPDGGAAYMFSGLDSRAFGSRRQSSLSSYPSFGLSSSGVESSGNFSDNESSGGLSTPSPPENKSSQPPPRTPLPVPLMTGTDTIVAVDTGSSSDSNASSARRRQPEAVASIADQPFIDQAPSAVRALVAPSHAAGGGDLFALGPSQVEHQRRARDSRREMARLGSSSSGESSSGQIQLPSLESDRQEERVGARDDDSNSSEAPREKSSTSQAGSDGRSGLRGGGGSILSSAAAAIVSVFTGDAKASTGEEEAASSKDVGGSSSGKRRLSGEVETDEPEAKKMMAKAAEGGEATTSTAPPPDGGAKSVEAEHVATYASGAKASEREFEEPGVSSYSTIDSTGTAIRNPPNV